MSDAVSRADRRHAPSTGDSPPPSGAGWPGPVRRPPTTPAARRSTSWPPRRAQGRTAGARRHRPGHRRRRCPTARIVDRPDWVRAAAESMRVMTGGDRASRAASSPAGSPARRPVPCWRSSRRASSASTTRSPSRDADGGCLLLVYPNVIAVERQLRVVARRFPAVGVPARGDPPRAVHRQSLAGRLHVAGAGRADPRRRRRRRRRWWAGSPTSSAAAATAARRTPNDAGILGLMRAVQSEPQRQALDQLLVLGTLLEGHADHVMDAVGPVVVPSVATIRSRFDERRQRKQPPLQRLLRALLGVDAKLSQYTRGKAFVDHVVDRVGMERFNTVWTAPRRCRCPTRSKTRSDGSTGCCSRSCGRLSPAFATDRLPGRRRSLVCGAVRWPGLAGADRRGGRGCGRPPR